MQSNVRRREEDSGWMVAVFPFLVGVAILTSAVFLPVRSAVAYVAPRPTVELVKTFKCWAENNACPGSIENEANAWLKSNQPGARILERKLKVTDRHIVLVIFYEVLEWRTQPQTPTKQPAEKP